MSTRVQVAILAVFTLLLTAAALGGAEAYVRHREKTRDTVPGTMNIYYPHQRLRQALVRGSHYYDWVSVNTQGFRGSRTLGAKREGVRRIIVMGESTTFDSYTSGDDMTWPARMEHYLPCEADVVNAGVPGYRLLDNVIRLHTEILRYQPDLIVLYHPNNDLFLALRGWDWDAQVDSSRPNEATFSSPLSRWLASHSLLYAKVLSRTFVVRGRRAGQKSAYDPDLVARSVARYRSQMVTFLSIARARGIAVAIVEPTHVSGGVDKETDPRIRAVWAQSFPNTDSRDLLGAYRRYFDAASSAAESFGADVIRTEDFGLRGTEWYAPGDPIHFNDAGADRMGRRMAERIGCGERLPIAT